MNGELKHLLKTIRTITEPIEWSAKVNWNQNYSFSLYDDHSGMNSNVLTLSHASFLLNFFCFKLNKSPREFMQKQVEAWIKPNTKAASYEHEVQVE